MSAFPAFGPKAQTHRLTAGGVTMRVVFQGPEDRDAPQVVFIPGGDQTAEGYSQQFARLAQHYRCIAYDPRGAGQTMAPPAPRALDHGRFRRGLCRGDRRLCRRAIVAGLSLGGLVTQQVAIGFSEDVQTPPAMCRLVADLVPKGRFHEIAGLGHVSMSRHRPDVVAAKLREIIDAHVGR